MIKYIITGLILLSCILYGQAQEKVLLKGMKITRSVKIKNGAYKIDAPGNTDGSVIIIEGENITVDFNNITLKGSNGKKNPDEFFGIGILIRNSKWITIKNLKVRGYKIALFARDVESLTLENCDLSYNYRQHLNSTQEKEDLSDWMSYHHNEKDEWLRYGAAMYLRGCDMAIIRNCRVTGGQNALMMMDCNNALVYNNDFSFNSGVGLGMYRCSSNKVVYNRINFNVRGYSDGIYSRGQDSAGILVYEQSNKNLFFKNSVTHGGDGFFLWAGQTTMDSATGGCNDNVLLGNDFSYAPANGVEVTFSRNKIIDNRIYECDYGIWGGYSFQTEISNNKFHNNRTGIAIEHGQDNTIRYNLFYKDREAIHVWTGNEQPTDLNYARLKDTRSRNYIIAMNSFNGNETVFNLGNANRLKIFGNTFSDCDVIFKTDSAVTEMDTTYNEELYQKLINDTAIITPLIEKAIDPFKGSGRFAGRKNIMITEWGPYDFRYPIIWNTNPTDTNGIVKFNIIGPQGKWKLKSLKGLDSISATAGVFPATITAKIKDTSIVDILVVLEYTGSVITTPFGETHSSGKPYAFYFRKNFLTIH